jgi:hypothetical protein
MPFVQPKKSADVFPISPIGNLPDQILLILHAPRKLVRLWQCQCFRIDTFKPQSDLLIDCSESCDHVSSTAPTKQS